MVISGSLRGVVLLAIVVVVGACGGSVREGAEIGDSSDRANSGDVNAPDGGATGAGAGRDAAIRDAATPEAGIDGTIPDVASPGILTGNATAISAGAGFACAILTDSTVRCWGDDDFGQLGNGATIRSPTPVAVMGLSGVTAVSAGNDFACALLSDGTVQCWGSLNYDELAGAYTCSGVPCSPTPVPIPGLSGVTAISAGLEFACALLSDGSVQCWGDNTYGELGNEGPTSPTSPVPVTGLTGATAISAGKFLESACALLSDGSVQCWGNNSLGQLGNGTTTSASTPVTVPGLSGVTAISAGYGFACAILSHGAVQCWGDNGNGQLGDGTTTGEDCGGNPCSLTPVAVSGLSGATAISAGGACALLSNGTVDCWGYNAYGELGNGTTADSPVPVAVSGLTGVTAISSSASFACALLSGGAVECWGIDSYGELGSATMSSSSTPVAVTW